MINNRSSYYTSWELDGSTLTEQELGNHICHWKNYELCHSQEEYDAASVKSKGRFCLS